MDGGDGGWAGLLDKAETAIGTLIGTFVGGVLLGVAAFYRRFTNLENTVVGHREQLKSLQIKQEQLAEKLAMIPTRDEMWNRMDQQEKRLVEFIEKFGPRNGEWR